MYQVRNPNYSKQNPHKRWALLTQMGATYFGPPLSPALGWVMHFFIGTIIWGILFVLLLPALAGAYWRKGVVFSIGAWLLLMILPMPMAGAGFFGLNLGIGAPIATLLLHLIFGAVLGGTYGWLEERYHHREEVATRTR